MAAAFYLAEAWAASSAGGEGHAVSILNLIFPLINFLIFLYIIKRFVVPLIRSHIHTRREEILDAVKSAGQEKEKAEAVLRDYQDRMGRVEQEIEKIREALRTEGEREKSKLIHEGEELGAKIREDVDFVAQQEQKIARQLIREEIARLAQAAAEKTIQANLEDADQERLVDQFLHRIESAQ